MNETFKIIRDNLTRSYIFYIPKSLYGDLQKTFLKGVIPFEATNTITLMDIDRNLSANIPTAKSVEVFTKITILEENMFLLIEAQAKLNLEQFGYLLKQYRKHLDAHVFITNWMTTNLNNCFQNVTEVTNNLFTTQSNNFKKHQEDVQAKFGSVETKLKSIELNKKFKEKLSLIDFKVRVPNIFEDKTKLKNKTSKPRKKKKIIISDDEADAFLLESVFMVNLNNDQIGNEK